MITPGDMSLVLTRKGRQLQLRIDGQDVGATDVAPIELGPVRLAPRLGTIQVRTFRVL